MNQKSSVNIVLGVVIVVIVCVSGYYMFLKKIVSLNQPITTYSSIENKISLKSSSITDPSSTTTVQTVNSLSIKGWKTYIDPKYNFSFKYPNNFPFGGGRTINNAYYIYQVSGPKTIIGEVIAELVLVPADKFRTDLNTEPVKISNLSQIIAIYTNSSYKISSFKTESGKNGLKISTNKDNSFFATYYILQDAYIYKFNTWLIGNDSIVSTIATTLDITNVIDPVTGQSCGGGGVMGNGGACPVGYNCKITSYGPPNEGICTR